eukprot:TRINITY_DN614_c0_g1_i8.p1 TRINITY_DN614_c0_g1~~TRINITY_DN614_c0_g1_i8.p1  ORF type:complete len:282 (+),score=49.43 TRINITY_DN614_c0_g1_i8:365-1210(+)
MLKEFRDKTTFVIKLAIAQTMCLSGMHDAVKAGKEIVPLLKKLLVMKNLIFGKEEMTKLDWIDNADYYYKALGVSEDAGELLLKEQREECVKAFIPIPCIDKSWIDICLSKASTLKNSSEYWITDAIYKASRKKFGIIWLPENFNDLISLYAHKECGLCGEVNSTKAVCLLCAAPVCIRKERSRVGELTRHSQQCRSGCGMYIVLHNNKVVLIDGGQACIYPSPYISKYEKNSETSEEKETAKLEIAVVEELVELYVNHGIGQRIRVVSLKSFAKFKPFSL